MREKAEGRDVVLDCIPSELLDTQQFVITRSLIMRHFSLHMSPPPPRNSYRI